jgi:hypothetical protein
MTSRPRLMAALVAGAACALAVACLSACSRVLSLVARQIEQPIGFPLVRRAHACAAPT